MAEVYGGWMRFRYPDGYTPPGELITFSRKAMGELLAGAKPLNLQVVKRRHELPDGSVVEVAFDGTTPIATLYPPANATPPTNEPPVNFWLPRGFVVYQAWADAPFGIGLPVIADPDAGPYDAANVAPGLDTARWTPGGVCGELLLSPDQHAGYPVSPVVVTVPLLFHPTKGPVLHWTGKGMLDARPPDGAWGAYRIELEPPAQHYPDESVPDMRALFEAVNAYRGTVAAAALNLPARGLYHPGQVMCSIMQAAGSTNATNAGYPPTYDAPGDRLTKDGFAALLYNDTFSTWSRNDNVLGAEFRAVGSVPSAVSAWEADPALSADYSKGATLDAGARGGYLCAAIESRDRWIQAGNQSWQSSDPALPPLSWFGFASMNLAWETLPSNYDPTSTTHPIVSIGGFTNGHGDAWLSYPRNTSPSNADLDPAMSRHIFCRGRAIALAPRGGLVWSAGMAVAVIDETTTVDRLIALVHHPEDQGPALAGQTRYLRVWWADIPRRGQLRADPQQVICGETDPWGWKGGDLIDVGMMPAPTTGFIASAGVNSLKYASQWRFAPSGERAVCLRDYGTQADYQLASIGNTDELESSHARTVELVFGVLPDELVTNVTVHDYTAGDAGAPLLIADGKPPLSGDTLIDNVGQPATLYDAGAYPVAVDYDESGALIYAFSVVLFTGTFMATDTGFARQLAYRYLGVGSAAAARLSDLAYPALAGANFKTLGQDFEPTIANVVDIRSGAFVCQGLPPRFEVNTTGIYTAGVYPTTPTDNPCLYFTSELVDGVRAFRQGAKLDERFFPNPDGAIWWPVARCSKPGDGNQVRLPFVSANVQAYHATRFGEHVLCYQVSPTPGAVLVLPSVPADGTCGCQLTQDELAGGISLHWMTYAELNPRGGYASASVMLPASDWLIYAKVV